ncbi:probable receptor-like protein kinase At1g80640 [Tripterygium wilfordii]|nr:probable receptor-like protein kinase At1g80640 [Tripterygium wilfordii]
MRPLLLVILLIHVLFFWNFQSFAVSATPDPLVPSPAASPIITPFMITSMAALPPGPLTGSEEGHTMDSHQKLLTALIAASTALGAIIILAILCCWIYSRKYHNIIPQCTDAERRVGLTPFLGKFSSLQMVCKKESLASFMDYKMLEKATSNFRDSNILGEGGFGRVYKAKLENNTPAAVKKLNCVGQDAEREFENEVDLLSKIQHPNIISILGYSVEAEMGFIVYELMENGSLETQLHGPSRGSALTWFIRMKIALDIARGLEYLHEHCKPQVIHRDLKSSNILLDSNFNAKLSDFGLAIADGTQSKNNMKLSGTLGYVAPEYILDGKLTDKSDVYAFGVVLLELLLGRKAVEKLAPAQCQSIITWAMPQLTDRSKLPNILDPVIKDTMDLKQLYQVAAIAVLCVQPEPSYRPLITDVLHSLIPLVPVELGGMLKVAANVPPKDQIQD